MRGSASVISCLVKLQEWNCRPGTSWTGSQVANHLVLPERRSGGSSAQQNASCLSNTMSRTTCKMITPLPTIWKREEKSKEESSEAV
jgi:hypothetical protein